MALHDPVSRRSFLKSVTFAAGVIIAGCGHQRATGASITLSQWYHQYGEHGTHEAVTRYAREYTRLHPHVAIEVVWVPGDYGTKVATALLVSGGPDVFEGSPTTAQVEAGQLAPLDDLFPPQVRADFDPKVIAENTINGSIYGVKSLVDLGLLYYRKSVLRAAGIEPPSTMDALIAASRKLTTSDRKGLFIGNDGGINALLTLGPWSGGTEFISGNAIAFNNQRTVLAYDMLRDLNNTGALLIGAPNDWWDASAFIQGQAAMQWCGLCAYPAIRAAFGEDVGIVPWPALDAYGIPVTFLGGWSSMVNAQSPNVSAAKDYVKWLWLENSKDQLDWCIGYGFHIPPRTSVARTAVQLKGPVPAKAIEIVNRDGKFLPPIWNPAMTTALTDAVTNIVKLGYPAQREVAAASEKCERELSRALEG